MTPLSLGRFGCSGPPLRPGWARGDPRCLAVVSCGVPLVSRRYSVGVPSAVGGRWPGMSRLGIDSEVDSEIGNDIAIMGWIVRSEVRSAV
eukprot:6111688-Pyramimonas_sp.AAC.1